MINASQPERDFLDSLILPRKPAAKFYFNLMKNLNSKYKFNESDLIKIIEDRVGSVENKLTSARTANACQDKCAAGQLNVYLKQLNFHYYSLAGGNISIADTKAQIDSNWYYVGCLYGCSPRIVSPYNQPLPTFPPNNSNPFNKGYKLI